MLGGGGGSCANGTCEPSLGEDCLSGAGDCNGKQVGATKRQFCCGDGDGVNLVACEDSPCTVELCLCSDTPPNPYCCGDGTCEGAEDNTNCAADCPAPYCGDTNCDPGEGRCNCPGDCGAPPVTEANCSDRVDNDCDGFTDGDDSDCDCGVRGDPCAIGVDCCPDSCKRNGTCR